MGIRKTSPPLFTVILMRTQHATNVRRQSSVRPITGVMVFLAMTTGCGVDQPTGTPGPSRLFLAKAPAGPTVTSTNPSYAHRGDTKLTVHVFGTGFTGGANAQWSLGTDTTSVSTESTSFVSATEIIAVIDVSGTAPIASYNVSVTNRDGKKGVGAELFAVTTAVVVGSGTLGGEVIVNEINDQGQVVGYFVAAGPFITSGNTIISLGATGFANGVSPNGDVVVGRDNAPVAWIRQASGSYVKETLPTAATTGGGAWHAAGTAGGPLVVGGYENTSTSKQSGGTRPVTWTRSGATWSSPTPYVIPSTTGTGIAVTTLGVMMGKRATGSNTSEWGVWDNPSVFSPLTAPFLQSINETATIVVGVLPNGGPGMWYRDVSTGQWNPTAVALPTTCGADGSAEDVNNDGVIVGYACGKAAVWRVDASVSPPAIVSGPLFLVGLGGNGTNASSQAEAVTSTSPYIVAGTATSGGHGLLVKWIVQ